MQSIGYQVCVIWGQQGRGSSLSSLSRDPEQTYLQQIVISRGYFYFICLVLFWGGDGVVWFFLFLGGYINTGRTCFCLALLVCSSYLKACSGEEEMESSDCSWPSLLSAGREAAGDEASRGREKCI